MLCIIMRGIAGSGKSTWVGREVSQPYAIVSTDNFFLDKKGDYHFDKSKLHYYHQCALRLFKKIVDKGISTIILDNTNIRKRDYKDYVLYAEKAEYRVVQKVCCGNYNNIHNVPAETIQQMRDTFEVDTDLPHWEGINNGNT